MLDTHGGLFTFTLAQVGDDLEPAAPNGGGPTPAAPTGTPPAGGDATTTDPGAAPEGSAPAPGLGDFMFPILLMVGIMWVLLILPQRREKKKRAKMMVEMTKGAKVQTVGGILGTIVELKEHEVVIKVDESSNTRMRFTRGAIHSVLPDGKPTEEK